MSFLLENDNIPIFNTNTNTTIDPMIDRLHSDIDLTGTLFDSIDRTVTRGGKVELLRMMRSQPESDISRLRKRQSALVQSHKRLSGSAARHHLQQMSEHELDIHWMFRMREDAAMLSVVNTAFFTTPILSWLNSRSPAALAGLNAFRIVGSPAISVLSPVIYCIVPYLVLCYSGGRIIGLSEYIGLLVSTTRSRLGALLKERSYGTLIGKGMSLLLTLALYFHGAINSVEVALSLRQTCIAITKRVEGATEFLRHAAALREYALSEHLRDAWFGTHDVVVLAEKQQLVNNSMSMSNNTSIIEQYCHTGCCLAHVKAFDYKAAASELRVAYRLDALASVSCLISSSRPFVWASFVDSASPILELRGMWHPALGADKAVENDIVLGKRHRRHMILTGPNAGGKSTLLRASLATVLLAQTLTVAPCSGGCVLSPFSILSSHIGVVDNTGSESLFQAEMMRAQAILDSTSSMPHGQHALAVVDEIFSSTNPVEGTSAAAACAHQMSLHPGVISIVSTHYTYLCRALKSTHLSFGMPVDLEEETGVVKSYPYKLRKGVCRQYVALELMRSSGFKGSLVNEAISVRASLLKRAQKKKIV